MCDVFVVICGVSVPVSPICLVIFFPASLIVPQSVLKRAIPEGGCAPHLGEGSVFPPTQDGLSEVFKDWSRTLAFPVLFLQVVGMHHSVLLKSRFTHSSPFTVTRKN